MGFIREPKGVDFYIKSDPLTEKDKKAISDFITNYKAKKTEKKSNKKLSV
jgi:hypothetical protein